MSIVISRKIRCAIEPLRPARATHCIFIRIHLAPSTAIFADPCGIVKAPKRNAELQCKGERFNVEIPRNRHIHFFQGDIDDTLRQAVGA
jgi:hypothetical protein